MAVLLCFLAAIVAGAAIVSAFHNPPAPTTRSAAAPIPRRSRSSAVSRVRAATDTADDRHHTASSGLHTISGIPTLTKVSAIVNPYVESLQHYQTTLADTAVPAPAKGAIDSVAPLVGQDARFLSPSMCCRPCGLGDVPGQFG